MTEENKKSKEETVTVPKETLELFKKELDLLKKDNKLLMQVADKKSLARYYSRHKEELPPVVKLNLWEGKVIVAWRDMKEEDNIVEQDPITMKWKETQNMELLLEDKTTTKIPYATFVRRTTQTPAKVIGNIEEDGQVALKVVREDNGQKYTINVAFVN